MNDVRFDKPPQRWARLIAVAVSTAFPIGAHAFEIQHAQASYVEEEYRFELTATLDASVEQVEPVLRDYEHYRSLDARILEAKVVSRDPARHVTTLETTLRACIGPICRNVKRIEEVAEAPLSLLATTDPQRSDMTFGETRMELQPMSDGRTRVDYHTRLKPAFWVPALYARRRMLTTLETATVELFRNVERRAQHAPTEPSP